MRHLISILLILSAAIDVSAQLIFTDSISGNEEIFSLSIQPEYDDSYFENLLLSVDPTALSSRRLTDDDYREVAEELGIDVAAMKAVVEIEAGTSHKGFTPDGRPIINFDLSMFRIFARRRGIALAPYAKSHAVVFASANVRKYGSRQAAQYARLDAAMTIDSITAIYGTFWGMFQIGGFNWQKCGASSPDDFVKRMSRSEREQLHMFAQFITSCNLVRYLRSHNWSEFARHYNGPGYARHSYHTRLARSYARHSK